MLKTSNEYGEWAVIIGASEGLGEAFAENLGKRGFKMLLVARGEEKLNSLADRLRSQDIECEFLVADLGSEAGQDLVLSKISYLDTGILVYNAALSVISPFLSETVDVHLKTIDVNCVGQVRLLYAVATKMKEKRKGGIVMMSSMSSLQGSPLISSYAASKAFIRILGESLWYELKEFDVDVIVCCAGATSTPNFLKSKPEKAPKFAPKVMEPARVVAETLSALGKTPMIIPGTGNKLASSIMKVFMSNKQAVRTMGETMYKLYPGKVSQDK